MSELNKSGISDSRSDLNNSIAPSNNPSEKDRSDGFVSAKIMPHPLPAIESKDQTDVVTNLELNNQFNSFSRFKAKANCFKKMQSQVQ